eukprot:3324604-Prymnesium_polylepis.1
MFLNILSLAVRRSGATHTWMWASSALPNLHDVHARSMAGWQAGSDERPGEAGVRTSRIIDSQLSNH